MVFEERFDDEFGGESVADHAEAPFDSGVDWVASPVISPQPLSTVLVVDDDSTKLKLLADKVRQILGSDIGVIATGDLSVVISVLRNGVNAVLTDYELNEYTGRDVAELAIECGVPSNHILVATGNPNDARAVVPEGIEVFAVPDELDALSTALRSLGRRLRGFIGEA